ncbi:SDR family oxidoreductase [Flavobacterium alkalisoli]|uniref:SDR family oxidoreductase n=1 Tax=Flavobacterium alkalisoli TaxID=2602769 RepID=UPI003A8D8345
MIAITGASGQLGQLVIDELLKEGVNANDIVALARSTNKLEKQKAQGVQVRFADYEDPNSLNEALKDVEKVLLISSSEVGKRFPQHKNVIEAAKSNGINLIAYTSILKADTSTLNLAKEHLATENEIIASGLNYVFLRNGWYTENYTMGIPTALEYSAITGAAAEGRISSAPRSDYALAAVKALTANKLDKNIYELAGDSSYSLTEFAQTLGAIASREISYNNIEADKFEELLLSVGLPAGLANMLAETESKLPSGQLYSESKDLSTLIGRPTETLEETIKKELGK